VSSEDVTNHRLGKAEEAHKALHERLEKLGGAVQAVMGKQDLIGEHLTRQDTDNKEIKAGVQDIQTILKGDGVNNPGVVARLANVERAVTNWVKAGWLMIGTLSVNFVWSLMTGRPK
jgi:hypothetical protein